MGVLAGDVGGMLWAPILLALALALLTAGSYAELVTKYPRAGGAAVFAERAFKLPLVSFLVGFAMLAAGVTSAAGLALAFSGDYLGAFIDVPPVITAVVFLALIGALNARGIKESLRANVVMTVIELGATSRASRNCRRTRCRPWRSWPERSSPSTRSSVSRSLRTSQKRFRTRRRPILEHSSARS
jgi:amino acid transporter